MTPNDCVTGSLAPYVPSPDHPWNTEKVQHLFKRVAFGLSPSELQAYVAKSPDEVVDEIIDAALNMPLPSPPVWANWTLSDYSDPSMIAEQSIEWISNSLFRLWDYGLREKMALFWSNHFVTELEVYRMPSWLYEYHTLLRTHALGNFKELTIEIGRSSAMLVYLNGVQNTRFEPNENYARELFELFTLGLDNGYTQSDITEAARALTGYNGFTEAGAPIGFINTLHDNARKTIFEKTGLYDYEGLHELLFEERKEEIASFICTKLCQCFVGKETNPDIIGGLSTIFINSNFDISEVLRALLKSEYFFDALQIGTKISSPVELILGQTRQLNIRPSPEDFRLLGGAITQIGQRIFDPPNVAGWPGDQSWLDTSLITNRWTILLTYIGILYSRDRLLLGTIGKEATTHFNEVELVCRDIIHHFMPWGLPHTQDYEAATQVFKYEIPENYFEDGSWNINWDTMPEQVLLLMNHISQLPEYQLN
jgi:uncharacterized protein (DUF1800 family)